MREQIKKCLSCGKECEWNTKFCSNCGRTEFNIIDDNITMELTPEDNPWSKQNNQDKIDNIRSSSTELKKKSKIKKIAITLVLIIIFSTIGSALGDIVARSFNTTTSNTSEEEYTIGTVTGNTYFNEWADISIAFPSNFSNASDDDYAEVSNNTTDCCMYFQEINGNSIMILAEDISRSSSITEAKYMDMYKNVLEENIAEAYTPFETKVTILLEDESFEIAGYTYYRIAFQTDFGLDDMYFSITQNMCIRKIGNKMLAIITSTNTIDEFEDLISLILKYEMNEVDTSVKYEELEFEASSELSDDIDSYQVQIMEAVYQFPVNYEDFVATGWKIYDDYNSVDKEIRSECDEIITFEKYGLIMNFYVYNPDIAVQTVDKCVIAGIQSTNPIDNKEFDRNVFIPGGFKLGEAKRDEVLSAFRDADIVHEVDSGGAYITYETDDIFVSTRLEFDKNSILNDITVKKPKVTDDYVFSTANKDYKAKYEEPKEMGSVTTDRIIKLGGDLYRMPVTVQALMENGWTTTQTTETIGSSWFLPMDMERDGDSIHVFAYNFEKFPIEASQGYIKEFDSLDIYDEPFEISGGIHTDMTEQALLDIIKKENITYEYEEYDDGVGYGFVIGEDELENYITVRFKNDEVFCIRIHVGKEWVKDAE